MDVAVHLLVERGPHEPSSPVIEDLGTLPVPTDTPVRLAFDNGAIPGVANRGGDRHNCHTAPERRRRLILRQNDDSSGQTEHQRRRNREKSSPSS